MFSPHIGATTSFHSCWKTKQNLSSSASQTEPLATNNEACQVAERKEISSQTDKEETTAYTATEVNDYSLLAFLHRVVPKVEKELRIAAQSRAFDGYSEFDENQQYGPLCIHTIRWQNVLPEHVIIDVGWSSTGSLLGVGYGVRLHDDWCSHKGYVAIWNINRNALVTSLPEQTLEISTCVTCLAFHPTNPALLAVGNIAGEVMVFDLSKTEELTPSLRADSGSGSITQLKWIPLPTSGKTGAVALGSTPLSLVSTTTQGTVLIWTLQQAKDLLSFNCGFMVSSEDIPRDSLSHFPELGNVSLTSVTFALNDSSRFLVGTEGGSVLVCSSLLMERLSESVAGMELNKCVTSSLYPHIGRVLQVSSSPFHRHAVHTLGCDKTLRLYSLLQPNKPVYVINSEDEVTCSQWCPSRPLIVAVGKVTGQVSFFNFANKNGESCLDLPAAAHKPSPISSLVFNKSNYKLLACGDLLGRVFIWQLPDSFISPSASEQNILTSIVQIGSD